MAATGQIATYRVEASSDVYLRPAEFHFRSSLTTPISADSPAKMSSSLPECGSPPTKKAKTEAHRAILLGEGNSPAFFLDTFPKEVLYETGFLIFPWKASSNYMA